LATSAFPTIANVVTPAYAGSVDILTPDLDFSANTSTNDKLGTPPNTMREIQIQFTTNTAGILSVTFNGTNFFPINNGDTIVGLSTFTIFVDDSTLLNFVFDTAASIILTVGG